MAIQLYIYSFQLLGRLKGASALKQMKYVYTEIFLLVI